LGAPLQIKIFGPRRDEVTGDWRRLHDEGLHGMYLSPNFIRVIKSRRMRWAGHVTLRWGGEVSTGFWWGNLRERDHLEDPSVDGRIILNGNFKKWNGRMECIDLAQGRDGWRTLVNEVMNLRETVSFSKRL
jgi:hypothetical protein